MRLMLFQMKLLKIRHGEVKDFLQKMRKLRELRCESNHASQTNVKRIKHFALLVNIHKGELCRHRKCVVTPFSASLYRAPD